MARTVAELPPGARITDYISLGVITKTFPDSAIGSVLARTGKASVRQRDLPAQVVVYYVIALALYMQSSYREVLRCLLEGVQWLRDPSSGVRVAGKSGISQARTRLSWEPVQQLHDELVKPIAVPGTRGAWYRIWRLASVDGSTFDVAVTNTHEPALGVGGAKYDSVARGPADDRAAEVALNGFDVRPRLYELHAKRREARTRAVSRDREHPG